MKTMSMKVKKQSGFSLIEIMVVVVIIGMLAGIVGPSVMGALGDSNKSKVKADISNLQTALKLYKLHNFRFPSSEQGLEALVTKPSSAPEPKNYQTGGYMDKLPMDPWGEAYLYVSPGEGKPYDIYTLGADGVSGGEEENADMSAWDEG